MSSNTRSLCKGLLILFIGGAPLATVATCVPNGNGGSFFFSSSGDFIEDTLEDLEDIFDD